MIRPMLAALLALAAAPSWAAFSRSYSGTSTGQFLGLPWDARGTAMGGAMGAAAEGVAALHWNPAGLASLQRREVMASYVPYLQDASYGFIGFAQPVESLLGTPRRELPPTGLGALAVGLLYFNAGPLQEIDNAGRGTGGTFTPADVALLGGWGGALTRALDFGVSLKMIRSQILASASTGAGDFGTRLRLRAGAVPYALSASLHDTFGHLKFHDHIEPLPTTARFGFAAQPVPLWTVSLDAVAPRDDRPYPAFGTELAYSIDEALATALRAGYSARTTHGQLDGLAAVTLGGGLGVFRFTIDYAWQPYGTLGDAHRLTLSYHF